MNNFSLVNKLQGMSRTLRRRLAQRPVWFGIVVLAAIAVAAVLMINSRPEVQELSCYPVKRGDFLISIVEGGTLEAVNEVVVRSEVEGVARIIFIVPEGSYAKKGDLIVELDSSSSQDAVNLQQINVEKAQFALLQAQQQLEIQKSVVESEIQAATLRVEFAQSDLEKFTKGQALQMERNAQIEITNVLETLHIDQERLTWSEKLYKEGFETKGNLDKDRLTVSQSKLKLEQAEKALWMVETFDNPKTRRSLEAALQEAKENLDRVKMQDDRKLAQFTADVESQKKTLELSQAKLERDTKQLLATKIYAPQDGLVVYGSAGGGHFSSESMIEEGAVVRNRQEIIKLPDVSEMKLLVKIHESHINQVHLGQPAYVVLDSMPDKRFMGTVNKLAPLPDSQSRWGNPDLKVYATEILVTDNLPDVKPGVSARAEVIITNLTDTLTVPIQAVTTRKGKQVVFLAGAPQEPVPVAVGMYNTKFIQITTGIKDGDQVLLAPPFDSKEKDLGGAIIAEGDAIPGGLTNQASRLEAKKRAKNGSDRIERIAGDDNAASPGRGEKGPGRGRKGTEPGGDPREMREKTLAQPSPALADSERRSKPDKLTTEPEQRSAEGAAPTTQSANQEMVKQFDADGDGKLSASELAAMRAWLVQHRGTNSPAGATVN